MASRKLKDNFFTPVQLVEFMTELCDITEHAKRVLVEKPDGRGIHRMPNVIDPSCGVGTFLNCLHEVDSKKNV